MRAGRGTHCGDRARMNLWELTAAELVAGYARGKFTPRDALAEVVARIDRLLNIAEYKRRQAAPGVKVTSRNFGRDRRYPITNKFRDDGQPQPKPDDTLVSRAAKGSAEAFDG